MFVLKQFNSSSKFLTVGALGLALLCFDSQSWAQQAGQSAFARGVAYQAQVFDRDRAPPFRTQLVGEVVTRPTTVQANAGTTVVMGNTAINTRTIIGNTERTASQLDVRCPLGGGRVVMFGNRVYNGGQIIASGESAQIVTRCDGSFVAQILSDHNEVFNFGRIKSTNN